MTKNNTRGQNGLDFLHSYDFKQILLKTFSQEALEIDQEKLEETAKVVKEKLGLDPKFRTIVMMKMASGKNQGYASERDRPRVFSPRAQDPKV